MRIPASISHVRFFRRTCRPSERSVVKKASREPVDAKPLLSINFAALKEPNFRRLIGQTLPRLRVALGGKTIVRYSNGGTAFVELLMFIGQVILGKKFQIGFNVDEMTPILQSPTPKNISQPAQVKITHIEHQMARSCDSPQEQISKLRDPKAFGDDYVELMVLWMVISNLDDIMIPILNRVTQGGQKALINLREELARESTGLDPYPILKALVEMLRDVSKMGGALLSQKLAEFGRHFHLWSREREELIRKIAQLNQQALLLPPNDAKKADIISDASELLGKAQETIHIVQRLRSAIIIENLKKADPTQN